MTNLIKESMPAIDKRLPFQALNLFLILFVKFLKMCTFRDAFEKGDTNIIERQATSQNVPKLK